MKLLFICAVLAASLGLCQAALALVKLDQDYATTTGARCLDGTAAGYYFEAGAESNKWVISLEGGGLCYDQASCTGRTSSALGSSNYFGSTYARTIVSSSAATNPGFWNWTRVHVPYCSGDLWTGTQTTNPQATWGLYFAGHLIFSAVVEELIALHNLNQSTEIVFAGTSAGALGLTNNMDWLNERLPDAEIAGVMNAGWFTDFEPSWSGPNFTVLLNSTSVLYQSRVNAACVAANPNNSTRCVFPYYAWNYLSNRLYTAQSILDTSLLQNLGFTTLLTTDGAPEYVQAVGEYLQYSVLTDFKRNPLQDGVFLTTCFVHDVAWRDLVIQGRIVAQNVADWYYRVPDAQRVTYDECDIHSAIELVKANITLLVDCATLMASCAKLTENPFARAVEDAQNGPVAVPSVDLPVANTAPSASPKSPITSGSHAAHEVLAVVAALLSSLML